MYSLLKMGIFHCHVSLLEGKSLTFLSTKQPKRGSVGFVNITFRRHGTTRIDGLNPLWVSTPRSWRWAFGELDCYSWTCGIFSCEWWHQKFHGCLPLPSLNSTNCMETFHRPFAAIKCDPFGCGVEGLHSDVTLPVVFNHFYMEHVLQYAFI